MSVTWRWTTTRCGAKRTGSRPASWPDSWAAFLAGAPLLTVAGGGWAHVGDLREQRAERSWHQVPAVPLQAAPQVAFWHWSSVTDWVRARWTPPGGRARVGEVPVPPGSLAGSTVLAWADRAGPVAGSPLTRDENTARVISTGLLAPAFLAVLVLGLAQAAWRLLDRRRLAAWEAAWRSTGPQWTQRR